MCGFVAVLTERTVSRLSHRGPDGAGAIVETFAWANVSLEMVRLAVVDQDDIDVPFDFRASCGVVLAYNGEVYNWRELRAELADGTPWQTECDAEVVARAWRRWGPCMLDRLNGMFGLIVVDERTNTVFIARDRAGEKPLYYTALGSGVAFASEIKALPIRLEEGPCAELDALEFDCLESTPFKGVRCLGPGEFMVFKSADDLRSPKAVKWWSLPTDVDEGMTWLSAVDETEALLVDAIRIRAACEVPVAVQLSGGLDSAIIQAVVKSDRLYTVTFPDDGVDNLSLAHAAAGGRQSVPITFGLTDVRATLDKIAFYLDTPATWSACAQWFMDVQIAKDGGIVVLSGEGADEVFGGYARYRALYWAERSFLDPHLVGYASLLHKLYGDTGDLLVRLLNRGGAATYDHVRELVRRYAGDGDLCARAARLDFVLTLPVLLRMADRMAAAHSLENRSPFLDYRLIELGARMPTRWKITERESKAVLREVARRLGVPSVIVDEQTKRGLLIPWSKWHGLSGWDRSSFAVVMRAAWRRAFDLKP